MDPAAAKTRLAAAGYKMAMFNGTTQCASAQPFGKIAFAGPSLAPPGATITVCPSNGISQQIYVPPVTKTPTKTPSNTPGRPTGPSSTPTKTRGRPTH
jgi:hypothetical protein